MCTVSGRTRAAWRGALGLIAVVALVGCDPSSGHATCEEKAPYVACGCGCCVGVDPTPQCLAAGESLCDVIAQDRAQAASPGCATAGCSAGVQYRLCAK